MDMPTPNYIDPPSRGPTLAIFGSVFVFAAAVAVVLRFWAHMYSRIFAADDIPIVGAWACSAAMTVILSIASITYGFNRHIWDVRPEWIPHAGKIAYAARILYALAAGLTRLSILLFYYRLVANTTWTRAYRFILHGVVAAVVILCTVTIGMAIWQCSPIWAYWAFPPHPGTTCREEGHEVFVTSVVSCILDASLVVLPLPVIWRLQLSLRRRLEAIALLCVGLIATGATIVRTHAVWRLWKGTGDQSWDVYPVYVASAVEINLGIVCACAPHVRPLIKKWVGDVRKKMRASVEVRNDVQREQQQVRHSVRYPWTAVSSLSEEA